MRKKLKRDILMRHTHMQCQKMKSISNTKNNNIHLWHRGQRPRKVRRKKLQIKQCLIWEILIRVVRKHQNPN